MDILKKTIEHHTIFDSIEQKAFKKNLHAYFIDVRKACINEFYWHENVKKSMNYINYTN